MLSFKPITNSDIGILHDFFVREKGVSCDYSVGGTIMWVKYFEYEYSVFQDTLFIKGKTPESPDKESFFLPIGKLCIQTSIHLLKSYCEVRKIDLILSPVPSYKIECLNNIYPNIQLILLSNWKDYIHLAKPFSLLEGNKYSKKRNHFNKFNKKYPDYIYKSLEVSDLPYIYVFFQEYCNTCKSELLQVYENEMVLNILKNYSLFHFVGGVIYIKNVVKGFCIGEIISNTLFIHIEKADIQIDGSYQALSTLFSRDILSKYPEVQRINREEDMGESNLIKSKMSYHPDFFIDKYTIHF